MNTLLIRLSISIFPLMGNPDTERFSLERAKAKTKIIGRAKQTKGKCLKGPIKSYGKLRELDSSAGRRE